MDLVLLPGNSKENKVWIDRIDTAFSPLFDNTVIHYYDHWWSSEENPMIDMEVELDKLAAEVTHLDRYVIFAKSAGALLSLYGIYEEILDPTVAMYAGIAINWGRGKGFAIDSWLTNYATPTLFVQKQNDPAYGYGELVALLEDRNVSSFDAYSIAGNDHNYDDVEQLKKFLTDFVDL